MKGYRLGVKIKSNIQLNVKGSSTLVDMKFWYIVPAL